MREVIEEAGWGIYPVLTFGLAAVVVGIRHARRPSGSLRALVNGLCTLTVLAGVLGAVTGIQKSAAGMPDVPPDERWIFLIGLRESLHNISAALILTILAKLAATIGSYRRALGPRAD